MGKYGFGILAGLWIAGLYAFGLRQINSNAMIWLFAALIALGGGAILGVSRKSLLGRNMMIALGITFAGWAILSLGVGNYLIPVFGNIGGALPGQFLYFLMGLSLLPLLLVVYLIARVIQSFKAETRKSREQKKLDAD